MIIGMDLLAKDETIVTLHPDPARQGARIDRDKYELLRTTILDLLRERGALNLSALGGLVADKLQEDFDGPVMWYFTTVKLDLVERGEIRRVPGIRPQHVELVTGRGEASI